MTFLQKISNWFLQLFKSSKYDNLSDPITIEPVVIPKRIESLVSTPLSEDEKDDLAFQLEIMQFSEADIPKTAQVLQQQETDAKLSILRESLMKKAPESEFGGSTLAERLASTNTVRSFRIVDDV